MTGRTNFYWCEKCSEPVDPVVNLVYEKDREVGRTLSCPWCAGPVVVKTGAD